jgi:hypothetical protein
MVAIPRVPELPELVGHLSRVIRDQPADVPELAPAVA